MKIDRYLEEEDYYKQQEILEEIAKENNLTTRAIRAKLSSMGVYKSKPKHDFIRKSELVDELIRVSKIEVNDSEIEYLNRLTKVLLSKLICAYRD